MAAVATNYGDGFNATGYGGTATVGPFTILGGQYAFSLIDGGTVSDTLEILGPDGSTYIPVATAYATSPTFAVVSLPPGKVQVVTGASGSGISVSLIRIPTRAA